MRRSMDRDGVCHVCGDKASGKHYGVPSCDGCRGFFKRSIRRNLEYTCKENGDCLIDVTRRNQCQACRFAKCLRVRMKRDAVQHERAPRINAASSNGLTSLSSTAGDRLGVITSNSSLYAGFIPFQPSFAISHSSFRSNSIVSESEDLNDNLSFGNENEVSSSEEIERKCDGKNTTYLPFSINCILSEDINECATKLLIFTVEWIKSIPSFLQLTERDKSVLLNETWNELFILNSIEWSSSFYDNLLTCPKYTQNSKKLTDFQKKLKLVTDRFHILRVDHTEFTCLKALTLFKSDAQNLRDRLHVEILQDQTQLMLQNYSAIRQNLRFGKLLLLLKLVGTFESRTTEELFFEKYPTDGNASVLNFIIDLLKQ